MTMLRNRLRHAGFVGKRGPSYNPMVDVTPLDPTHQRLQGRIDGEGLLDGALRATQRLSGLIQGDGMLYGHLWPPLLLKGRIEGEGALYGELHQVKGLSGLIDGGGELTGTISMIPQFPTYSFSAQRSASAFSLPYPSGAEAGDLMILYVGTGNSGAVAPASISGWTQQVTQQVGPGGGPYTLGAARYWRVCDGPGGSIPIPDMGVHNIAACVAVKYAETPANAGNQRSSSALSGAVPSAGLSVTGTINALGVGFYLAENSTGWEGIASTAAQTEDETIVWTYEGGSIIAALVAWHTIAGGSIVIPTLDPVNNATSHWVGGIHATHS